MGSRQCPHCGQYVAETLSTCPNCRELLDPAAHAHYDPERAVRARRDIRWGLIWMFVAAVIQYYSGGHDPFLERLPVDILPLVNQYLVPFLFLAGLALATAGAYRRLTA